MSSQTSFNLVDEPWILAQRRDGSVTELSLLEVFEQAADLDHLHGDLPTQVFALNRLLLAIVYRASLVTETTWQQSWRQQRLPLDDVTRYLRSWRHRFDLFDPERPFYQVADLATAKGRTGSLTGLVGDAPGERAPFLTTRSPASLESLPFAEAARWLVHCHAFDVSGIKSGAVGDPRVKGGRGYPIGVGAAGHLGGVLVEGENQLQTLLLNLVPQEGVDVSTGDENESDVDLPTWELTVADGAGPRHPEPATNERPHRPAGQATLYTWQARRIRLATDGRQVTGVLVCNGDRFSALGLHDLEPMSVWRDSPAQAKRYGLSHVTMPRAHQPGRSTWRGLEGMLTDTVRDVDAPRPGTLRWLDRQAEAKVLDDRYIPRVRSIGIHYVSQSAVVRDLIDDELSLPVRALHDTDSGLRSRVLDEISRIDDAVEQFVRLSINIAVARGEDDPASARTEAQSLAFSALDGPFRAWLVRLAGVDESTADTRLEWDRTVRRILIRLADDAVNTAGPHAWAGRRVDGRRINAPRAEAWFRTRLSRLYPHVDAPQESA
ncbi:type I-E CRISPR-associated protein Cse1/CasA [Aeromicrobium sp. CTD01-1L150]|uniref:type I-E CRISPR-associated protein Cse1/CasA n=1 Tax=Aeromicrobium sp. CTD01-1L150 TaxID=3341830 RepID=UPI0035BEDC8F